MITLAKTSEEGWLKVFAALGGAAISYLFPEPATKTLAGIALSLIVMDTLTGVFASMREGSMITSKGFRRVLFKVVGYSSVVLVASLSAHAVSMHWKDNEALAVAVATGAALLFVVLTESISILENVRRMGIPIPVWLVRRLKKFRKDLDGDDPTKE